MNRKLRKEVLSSYLMPLIPVGVALVILGGIEPLSIGALLLGGWLAWRQAGKVGRGLLPPVGSRRGRGRTDPSDDAAEIGLTTASVPATSAQNIASALTREAARRGGALTVMHGVLATGASSRDVTEVLEKLETDGYVTSERGRDGTFSVYRFHEIESSRRVAA